MKIQKTIRLQNVRENFTWNNQELILELLKVVNISFVNVLNNGFLFFPFIHKRHTERISFLFSTGIATHLLFFSILIGASIEYQYPDDIRLKIRFVSFTSICGTIFTLFFIKKCSVMLLVCVPFNRVTKEYLLSSSNVSIFFPARGCFLLNIAAK